MERKDLVTATVFVLVCEAAGIIGAGKSTLAKALGEHLDFAVYY